VGNNLEVSIANTTDKIVIRDWYLGAANQVEQFVYVDGAIVSNTQVSSLITAMAQFGAMAGNETSAPRAALWRPVSQFMTIA
jgi:hypothetical protein